MNNQKKEKSEFKEVETTFEINNNCQINIAGRSEQIDIEAKALPISRLKRSLSFRRKLKGGMTQANSTHTLTISSKIPRKSELQDMVNCHYDQNTNAVTIATLSDLVLKHKITMPIDAHLQVKAMENITFSSPYAHVTASSSGKGWVACRSGNADQKNPGADHYKTKQSVLIKNLLNIDHEPSPNVLETQNGLIMIYRTQS